MRGTNTEVLSTIGPSSGLFLWPCVSTLRSYPFHRLPYQSFVLNLVTVSRVRSTSILNRFQALFV